MLAFVSFLAVDLVFLVPCSRLPIVSTETSLVFCVQEIERYGGKLVSIAEHIRTDSQLLVNLINY
jgi:hypothetical protein